MSNKANVIVLSAPSGAGKTSLARRAMDSLPDLCFSVSHTTRSPRGDEKHGIDYFFVTRGEFEEMTDRGIFLEHAQVHGHDYGTSRRFVEEQLQRGQDVLLDIDVQGALQVRRKMPECLMVFVLPPSLEELERRLRGRGVDDPVEIEKRLQGARREIGFYNHYDYIIVNDRIDESVNELKSIIQAARCRLDRRRSRAGRVARSFEEELSKTKERG